MQVLAITNQKGGVGKTTTAVNLAAIFAQLGRRVVIIDLDPQAHSTAHYGVDPEELDRTIYQVLLHDDVDLPDILLPTCIDRLRLAPADLNLAAAETQLQSHLGREWILAGHLEPLRADTDIVVLDSPPNLGLMSINALTAATVTLIPLKTQYLSLKGLHSLHDTIHIVERKLRHHSRLVYLPTMVDTRTRQTRETLDTIQKQHPAAVTRTWIHSATVLAEAPRAGKPISVFAPDTRAAVEYRDLAVEILELLDTQEEEEKQD